jgi:hypothetical protein
MSAPTAMSLDENAVAQGYIDNFKRQLTKKLEDPNTDPDTAAIEAAHSTGLYAYISNLESSIADLSKRVGELSQSVVANKPARDADPQSGLTPFELAAPVMRSNAKASVRQSIGIVIAEVGVVAIAIFLLYTLFRGPPPATQFGQAVLPDKELRTYVLFASALMIVASIAGVVYVV